MDRDNPQMHACKTLRFRPSLCKWMGAVVLLVGCGAGPAPAPEQNQMVYYDRGTKQPVVSNISREIPAIHPDTGQATLVPASYCSQCGKWFPSPPIEIRERNPNAAVCPKGHMMTTDGPWPEAN